MAIVTVPQFQLPAWEQRSSNVVAGLANVLLDAAGEKVGLVFRPPKSGNIAKVCFRSGAIIASGGNVDVRLETLDASGHPSGTLFGTNTNATQAVSTTVNTWYTTTLTAVAAVTPASQIGMVLVNSTGNYNLSSMNVNHNLASGHPYGFVNQGANVKNIAQAVAAFEYDDGSYEYVVGTAPYKDINTVAYNTGSTPDERGLYFQYPVGIRVWGCWALIDPDGDGDFNLYDADGSTVLATATTRNAIRATANQGYHVYPFDARATLSAATNYRLTLMPAGVTSLTLIESDVNSVALMGGMPGGPNFHHTSRTNAGAWTQTDTKVPWLGLIVDGIDSGGGSSGPVGSGRLTGGLQ